MGTLTGTGPKGMRGFMDRREAGRALADELAGYRGRRDVIVLALPRGGVPVAYEVARRLGLPLDIFLVRKLGMPGHEEYAVGAIASGGVRVDNEGFSGYLPADVLRRIEARERAELERREHAYRGDRPPLDVRGRTAILVDDGLATGSSMRAAIAGLRRLQPAAIIVAVPVAGRDVCEELRAIADSTVCVFTPEPFRAVGLWYDDFSQTTDEEVRLLLAAAAPGKGAGPGPGRGTGGEDGRVHR
jgi:putative phosphoribosyl transferase